MAQFRDLSRQRFGRLTVAWPVGQYKNRKTVWLCVCDCGKLSRVSVDHLTAGHVVGCGCVQREWARKNPGSRPRHGHATKKRGQTPEYRAWRDARTRCTNPNAANYSDYGGRGIEFRFSSFDEFIAEIGPRPAGLTLDRINNDGHYEKGNVRWATKVTQRHNQRKPCRSQQS